MLDNRMSASVSPDWVRTRLQTLTEYSEALANVEPGVTNEFSSWSALKLILLSGTIDTYTSIIPNHYENYYYIDALAGSGISEFEEQDEYFVGSPIVAGTLAHEPFDRMYFIENNNDCVRALRERLDFFENSLDEELCCDDYRVINGNTNNIMSNIIDEIEEETLEQGESVNTLSFVDNQGLNVHYDTIQNLTRLWGDLLINFPTTAVRRTIGANYQSSLNNFYGDNSWKTAQTSNNSPISDEKARVIYESKLVQAGRPIQATVPVNSGGSYYYDMIYCTRETSNGSPYVEAMEYMADKIEQLDGDDVGRILRMMRGERTSLDIFNEQEDDGQTGIGDFL